MEMLIWTTKFVKMKKFILIFFFVSNISFAQKMSEAIKNDTIYILFKKGEGQNKLNIKGYYNNGYVFLKTIFFKSEVIVNNQYDNIKIRDAKVICKPKKFLKKIKDKTIDIEFMKPGTNLSFVDSLCSRKRVYFIVDEADYKKNKLKLTEVNAPVIVVE